MLNGISAFAWKSMRVISWAAVRSAIIYISNKFARKYHRSGRSQLPPLIGRQKRARRLAASSRLWPTRVRLRGTMPWSQPWYVVRRIVGGSLLYTRTTELSVCGRAFVPCVLLQAPKTVKVTPRQRLSSVPVPPQGAPVGSGQLGTPRKRPARWAISCLPAGAAHRQSDPSVAPSSVPVPPTSWKP